MRIFYAAGNQPHGALNQSKIWYYNLFLPLCDLGHDVIQFDYDLEPFYRHANENFAANLDFNITHRPQLESELLRQIKLEHQKQPIDLFFSYFYGSFVDPEIIQEIRNLGIVTVNWYCNASYQFHLVQKIAPSYDYCLVPEKFRLDDYLKIGANPIYCQEAANPNIYRSWPVPREFDVTFVGSHYGDRGKIMRHLLDHNIDIKAWGPGWDLLYPPSQLRRSTKWWLRRFKRILKNETVPPILSSSSCGGMLTDEEMIQMYSRSKISLGFSNVGETHASQNPIKQVRLRDFEAPMSGAFYMVEYMQELEEFFEPGKEIIFYGDNHDLVEKISYFLRHDTEREQIRQAGFERAHRDHTWQLRFTDVFSKIGLTQ